MARRTSRVERRDAVPIGDLLAEVFPESPLAKGYAEYRVRTTWKEAADSVADGAGERTIRIWLRKEDGTLFVNMASSVIAARLRMYRSSIMDKVNKALVDNGLDKEYEIKDISIR